MQNMVENEGAPKRSSVDRANLIGIIGALVVFIGGFIGLRVHTVNAIRQAVFNGPVSWTMGGQTVSNSNIQILQVQPPWFGTGTARIVLDVEGTDYLVTMNNTSGVWQVTNTIQDPNGQL